VEKNLGHTASERQSNFQLKLWCEVLFLYMTIIEGAITAMEKSTLIAKFAFEATDSRLV